MENNRSYFTRRAMQERAAAAIAANPKAQGAHLELAEHYEGLAGGPLILEQQPEIHSVA